MSVLISVPIGMAISQYSNLNHACDYVGDFWYATITVMSRYVEMSVTNQTHLIFFKATIVVFFCLSHTQVDKRIKPLRSSVSQLNFSIVKD